MKSDGTETRVQAVYGEIGGNDGGAEPLCEGDFKGCIKMDSLQQ